MSDDDTQDGAEPSPASAGSHAARLCAEVMAHAAYSPHTFNSNVGHVMAALRVLFQEDDIVDAKGLLGIQHVGPAPVERGGATSVTDVGGAGPTPTGVCSGSQPVAWAVIDDDGVAFVDASEAEAHRVLERAASGKFACRNPRMLPLYRSPSLTEDEIDAIEHGLERLELHSDADCEQSVKTLISLLKRLDGERQ